MAKIPIILESGRADGKLANSGAIFDENKGMFQSEINDIQDTLNSNNPNKPLSAKQGKILKELLDTKVIEAGNVPLDNEPTEGHTTHVPTSDAVFNWIKETNGGITIGNVVKLTPTCQGSMPSYSSTYNIEVNDKSVIFNKKGFSLMINNRRYNFVGTTDYIFNKGNETRTYLYLDSSVLTYVDDNGEINWDETNIFKVVSNPYTINKKYIILLGVYIGNFMPIGCLYPIIQDSIIQNLKTDLNNTINTKETALSNSINSIANTLRTYIIEYEYKYLITELKNGTPPNTGNAHAVYISTIQPFGKCNRVYLETNRPNTENCIYCYGYFWYNEASGNPSISIMDSNNYTKDQTNNYIDNIAANKKKLAKGFTFCITEYNTVTNTFSPLRINDFKDYNISLKYINSSLDSTLDVINKNNYQLNFIIDDTKFKKGGTFSPSFPYNIIYGDNLKSCVVLEEYLPVSKGIEFTVTGCNFESYPMIVLYDSNKIAKRAPIIGKSSTSSITESFTIEEGEAYMRISYCTNLPFTINANISTVEDLIKKHISPIDNKIDNINNDLSNIHKTIGIINYSVKLANGTTPNPGNANAVQTEPVPVEKGDIVSIIINRPVPEGHYYAFGNMGHTQIPPTWPNNNYFFQYKAYPNGTQTFIIPDTTCKGFTFNIVEKDENNTYYPLRVNDFSSNDIIVQVISGQEKRINNLEDIVNSQLVNNAYTRNKNKESALINACRYYKKGTDFKDYQTLIITDIHGDSTSVENAIIMSDNFSTIDSIICLGDIVASNYIESYRSVYTELITKSKKPVYTVLGNHDAGNAYAINVCSTHSQAYNTFIKPMIDKGWLTNGEYIENKCYWYHDIPSRNIRLIGLYEYDAPLDINETYWKAIPYNSALDKVKYNTIYNIGQQVNAGEYTDSSFECIQNVTTSPNFYTEPHKLPSYKIMRGRRVISQEQAEWFLNTLYNTPNNTGIVVLLHNPVSENVKNQYNNKFAQTNRPNDTGSNGGGIQSDMVTNFITNAIHAFNTRSNYNEKIRFKGDASYLNIISDTEGNYAYQVSKDFSTVSTNASFICYLGGHSHKDYVWKEEQYNQYQIAPVCTNNTYWAQMPNADIRKSQNKDDISFDSLTSVSFDIEESMLKLVRLGGTITEYMENRDYECINLNI